MILVDSSVWIEYFRKGIESSILSNLLDLDLVYTNEIILTELIPVLFHKKEFDIIENLRALAIIPLEIYWEGIIALQNLNLKNGLNRVGIPDLFIAQQCISQNIELWTFDKHFQLMAEHTTLKLFRSIL